MDSDRSGELSAILSSMAEALVAVDNDRRVILMNQAAAIMLRVSPVEAAGQALTGFITFLKDDQLLGALTNPVERAIREKNIITLTFLDGFSIRNRQGQTIPASLMAAPLIKNGQMDGAILLFRDITKEREVDRAKTEFVSLASHQLKTPLSAINWYAEMLLDGEVGPLTDKQREYLTGLYGSAKRMVELVNALLNVSRLELGTFIVEPVPTDVLQLAREVLEELRPGLAAKKITVGLTDDKTLPLIPLDPKLTRMILQNLLTNAVKYTAAAGEVALAITRAEDDLLIRVGDTGYGIPSADQTKIFTKLFRAENVRDKEADGTGLGLYLVKSIIEHVGGRIWFDSLEGKGTTFYVTLPLTGMPAHNGSRPLA